MRKEVRLVTLITIIALLAVFMPRASAQGAVKLLMWGGSSGQTETDALNAIVAKFNAANPNIQAEFVPQSNLETSLNKALAAGNPPDVFYVDSSNFLNLVQSG